MNISLSKLRWRYYGGGGAVVGIVVGLGLGSIFEARSDNRAALAEERESS